MSYPSGKLRAVALACVLGVIALSVAAGLGSDDRLTVGIELAAKNVGLSAIVALTAHRFSDRPPLLASLHAASVSGRVATGSSASVDGVSRS